MLIVFLGISMLIPINASASQSPAVKSQTAATVAVTDKSQVSTYAQLNPSGSPAYAVKGAGDTLVVSDAQRHTLQILGADKTVSDVTARNNAVGEYAISAGGYKDGPAGKARLNTPNGIARDEKGLLYVADSANGAIRIVDQKGAVRTLADGLNYPTGIVLGSDGALYVAETLGHRILKIDVQGLKTVLAGGGYPLKEEVPEGRFADGRGEQAQFNEPRGLAIDADGNLYVADTGNQRIRKVTPEGIVTTLAGAGTEKIKNTPYISGGYQDGNAETALFNFPTGLAVSPNKTVYVADSLNHCIRAILPSGVVRTLAGTGVSGNKDGPADQAQFNLPTDILFWKDGSLLIIDQGNALVRICSPAQSRFSLWKKTLSESTSLTAAEMATFKEVTAGVYVKRGGGLKEYEAVKGMTLAQGDFVRTDKKGSATLVFATGSKLSVAPDTAFTLSTAVSTKKTGEKITIQLKWGTLWNKVDILSNTKNAYEIVSPAAVMRAKGTLFLVSVDPVTGNTTGTVMEGTVGAQQNTMGNTGPQEQLVFMGSVIQVPPSILQYSAPQPPPPPAPINMNTLVESQSPVILGNIALDVIERMQELQEQSQAYFTGYQNTGNPEYIQGALQFSQINALLADLSQHYLDAIQGAPQEQVIDQILQQQNSSVAALQQQSQQLSGEATTVRNAFIEAAQQAGLIPVQIDQLLQNTGAAGAIPALPSAPVPPSQYTSGSGGSGNSDSDDDDSDIPALIPLTSLGNMTDTAQVGSALTAGSVTPVGATVSYQWLIAGKFSGSYSIIPGATSNTYTPAAADQGMFIKVRVIGCGRFTGTVISEAIQVAANQTTPISDFENTAFSATEAVFTWTAAATAAGIRLQYITGQQEWQDCTVEGGSLAANATTVRATGLEPNTSYCFKLVVTGGDNSGDSNIVQMTTSPPNLIPLTEIADITGMARPGHELMAGDITPEEAMGNVDYQWMIGDAPDGPYADIADATSNVYTPGVNDIGKFIKIRVTGRGGFTGTVISHAVQISANQAVPISDFENTEFSATEAVFSWTAAANATGIRLQYTFGQQAWQNCMVEGESLAANATTARVTGLDPNMSYYFKLVVTGGDNSGDSNIVQVTTSAPNPIPLTEIADIIGTAQPGIELTTGNITPEQATVDYQWMIGDEFNGAYTSIAGATSNTYTPGPNDIGKFIKVRATGCDGFTGTVTSGAVQVSEEPPTN